MNRKILLLSSIDSVHIRRLYSYFENQPEMDVKLFIARSSLKSKDIFSLIWYYLTIRKNLKRVINKYNPDVINIHTILFPNYLVPKYFHSKLIITPWNGDILWYAYGKEFFFLQRISKDLVSKIKEKRISKALNQASLITCNSNAMRIRCEELLTKNIRLENIQIPGIKTSEWIKSDNKNLIRSQLNIPNEKFVILSVRNLSEWYNLDIITKCIKPLVKKYIDLLFIFRFQGKDGLQKLIKIIKDDQVESYVLFIGELDYNQVLLYYQASDIGISISSYDSSPQSVIEGMSTELPMIVGEIQVTKEIIENRKNGMLIPCRDEGALIEAISFIKENPSQAMKIGKAARDSILLKHDFNHNMKKFHELYNSI